MKKLMLVPLVGAAGALTFGAAAALNTTGDHAAIQLGTTAAGEFACATNVVVAGWGYESDDDSVRSVRLDVVDDNNACNGADVFVDVLDAAGNRISGGTTTINSANATQSVPLAPFVNAGLIEGLRISIEG
jgi:hypothetical protein